MPLRWDALDCLVILYPHELFRWWFSCLFEMLLCPLRAVRMFILSVMSDNQSLIAGFFDLEMCSWSGPFLVNVMTLKICLFSLKILFCSGLRHITLKLYWKDWLTFVLGCSFHMTQKKKKIIDFLFKMTDVIYIWEKCCLSH